MNMHNNHLYQTLQRIQAGSMDIDEAYRQLEMLPYENLGFARLDHHRAVRDNFPEVIYCEGKSVEQITEIFKRLAQQNHSVIGTRVAESQFRAVKECLPDVQYNPTARLLFLQRASVATIGKAAVITAGTADIPVAEEAALCMEIMGAEVARIFDVGVAGIHRVIDVIPQLNEVRVVIVVAGMEGALASVVGGLTKRPVIAVPTSVGYGASFKGLAALLAMLNSCASGVGVVNIDNGYGAAALAVAILNSFNG